MNGQLGIERRREARDGRPLAGAVLIGVGALLLVNQWWPDVEIGRFVALLIGLVLLGGFLVTRAYGWLVAGCIVTGVGAGVVLATDARGTDSGAAVLISLGAGFLAIWLISTFLGLPGPHWWPVIPGGILATIGVLLLVGGDSLRITQWWPIALVVIGGAVLVRAFTARREPR